MNVIFDWAGTLADDKELTWQLTRKTILHFGGDPVDLETYIREFQLPAEGFYRRYCPGIHMDEIESFFGSLALSDYPFHVGLFAGINELLVELASRYHLYLLSSLPTKLLQPTMESLGIWKLFSAVWGDAADKRLMLPALMAKEKLSRCDVLYIGDTPHDVEAARLAKIQSAATSYGYTSRETLEAERPDNLFDSVKEMSHHFENLRIQESGQLPIVTVGGLIFNAQGEALFIRTEKWSNLYGTPGGKVHYGETLEQAFHREIAEETGLATKDVRFILNQDCIEHPEFHKPRHFILVNFIASLAASPGAPEVILNYESNHYVWTRLEDALRLPLNQPTRYLTQKLIEMGIS